MRHVRQQSCDRPALAAWAGEGTGPTVVPTPPSALSDRKSGRKGREENSNTRSLTESPRWAVVGRGFQITNLRFQIHRSATGDLLSMVQADPALTVFHRTERIGYQVVRRRLPQYTPPVAFGELPGLLAESA